MRLVSLSFAAGILCLQQLSDLPPAAWVWLMLPLLVAAWRLQRLRTVLAFAAGFLWMLMHAHGRLAEQLPEDLQGKDLLVQGSVESIPEQQGRRLRFRFVIDRLHRNGSFEDFRLRVRLNWYGKAPVIVAGSRWQLQLRLKRPNGFMNSAGFDYESWLFQQGIRATGYVRRSDRNRKLHAAAGINALRQGIADRFRLINSGSGHNGMLTALAVGARGDISDHQWQVLRHTGTTHLMAISGLHVGMVSAMVFWLASLGWRRSYRLTQFCATPRAAAVIALLAALGYAALAGFSVPTQRALVMIAVVMLAIWSMRPVLPSYGLAMALLLVLLIDPFSMMSIGFWLSFMAVAVIFYAIGSRHQDGHRWQQAVRVQWVVSLALVPLTLFLFSQASLVSPLANLIAVPWVSLLVVPLVLLASLLLVVSDTLASLPLWLADTCLDILWPLLETMASWSWSSWQRAGIDTGMMLAALLAVFLLLSPGGFPSRRLGLILLTPLILNLQQGIPEGDVRLTVLDVGQGLAVVVRTRHRVLVYDTGPRFSRTFDTGHAVVVPYLLSENVQKIDKIIISHTDNDHRGGLESILDRYPMTQLLSGIPEKLKQQAESCHRFPSWRWDGVEFRFLDSGAGELRKGNNRSCVLKITAAGGSVLIPGDIERKAEAKLLKNSADLQADILLVPHHGSMTSSSKAFLAAVMPRWAVVSSGYRNRFRHPRAEIRQRYRVIGSKWLNTRDTGMLVFSLSRRHGIRNILRYRQQAGKYWHRR